jgi:hypothetical protein
MANMKTGGLRDLLEELAAKIDRPVADDLDVEAAAWTPIV